MNSRINNLLRTNTALILLSIISIGVLILLFRHPARTDFTSEAIPTPSMTVSSNTEVKTSENDVKLPQLRHMPAVNSFKDFEYTPGKTISISTTCHDTYSVIIIFPESIDYRADPSSAIYNTASPCVKGKTSSETIDLSPFNPVAGESYYIVRASEGKTGAWYDPY